MSTNENAFTRGEWKNGQFYPHGGQAGIGSSMAERVARQQQASLPEPNERDDDLDELPAPPHKVIPEADLELLELAARALGARFEEVDGEGYGNLHFEDGSVIYGWNSLLFSGDTLELAVTLSMHVSILRGGGCMIQIAGVYRAEIMGTVESQSADVRRAVTRAAAEIGKQHS